MNNSLRKIADDLGVPKTTIHNHLRKYGSLDALIARAQAKQLKENEKKMLISQVNKRLWDVIHFTPRQEIQQVLLTVEAIVKQYQVHGITFKGYEPKPLKKYDVVGCSEKSIRRNIGDCKEQRKERRDKEETRNELARKMEEQFILPLACHIYMESADGKLKRVVDRMIDFAKTGEDERFYEIAAIPADTLYKIVKRKFMQCGMEGVHEYANHYNKWFAKGARCTGAFTEDIPFGTILMDDNKKNVHKAWVYNEQTRKNELVEIKSWNAIESRTGKYLSYRIKASEFKVDDLLIITIEALKKMGATKLIVDNGLASKSEFKNFIIRLNFALKKILGEDAYQVEYIVASPHNPTGKAPVEGSFGITKKEFDTTFNNFVGDNHKVEGRHKTNNLTPQEANYTFDDYAKKFDDYIYGWYETRKRRLNYGKEKNSIREYFNRLMDQYQVKAIPDRAFRYALQKEKSFVYKGSMYLTIESSQSYYMPVNFGINSIPESFRGRRFKILYNPADLAEVDLYTAEAFLDRMIGLYYEAGQYVCTLGAVKELDVDKKKLVVKHNNERKKLASKISTAMLPIDTMAAINKHGKIEDTPKMIQKEIAKIINEEKPLEKIAAEAKKRVEENNHSFTIEELDKIINQKTEYK